MSYKKALVQGLKTPVYARASREGLKIAQWPEARPPSLTLVVGLDRSK